MLPKYYRFTVRNETGQTIAASGILVTAVRKKITSAGAASYESSEAEVLTNTGTLATATNLAGTFQDNSTPLWLEGDFVFEVTAPASSAGNVILYLDRATDATPTSIDDPALGAVVAVLNFTAADTKRVSFSL